MKLTLYMIAATDGTQTTLKHVYARDRTHAVKKSYRWRKRHPHLFLYEVRAQPCDFQFGFRRLAGYIEQSENASH